MLAREREAKQKEVAGKKGFWWIKRQEVMRKEKAIEELKLQLEQTRKEQDDLWNVFKEEEVELEQLDQMTAEKEKLIAEEFAKPRQN